jgi:hypothetical protein
VDPHEFGEASGPSWRAAERTFHNALRNVSARRIEGERLEFLDESGASQAQFESRYLR